MIRDGPWRKNQNGYLKKPNSWGYRYTLLSTFIYVSFYWLVFFIQYHPSGKNYFSSRFQIGSKELLKLLQWTGLSSQITDPPRGNIRMLLNLSVRLSGACGAGLGVRRHTRKYKQEIISAPATTSGVWATHIFLHYIWLKRNITESHKPPSKCHWKSKEGVFFTWMERL